MVKAMSLLSSNVQLQKLIILRKNKRLMPLNYGLWKTLIVHGLISPGLNENWWFPEAMISKHRLIGLGHVVGCFYWLHNATGKSKFRLEIISTDIFFHLSQCIRKWNKAASYVIILFNFYINNIYRPLSKKNTIC